MNRRSLLLLLPALLLLPSCASFWSAYIGPAFPERDVPIYLKRRGYDAGVVQANLRKDVLSEELFDRLAAERDRNTRFLIGHNPHLPARLLEKLSRDRDDFVRGGAAHSSNLTAEQLDRLFHDPSHTTRIHLAANPAVPSKVLVRLHMEQPDMDLLWFALNPNCPEELKKKMRKQNDQQALHMLKVMENWKRYAALRSSSAL